jgi:hypothetical protein
MYIYSINAYIIDHIKFRKPLLMCCLLFGLLLAPPPSTVRIQFQEEYTKSFEFRLMSYLSFDPLKTKLNLNYIYIYIYIYIQSFLTEDTVCSFRIRQK